jgi:hypothetical protein
MTERERMIVDLVAGGVLEVDSDGRFWRLQVFTRAGRLKPVTRRTADSVRPDGYVRVRATVGGRAG